MFVNCGAPITICVIGAQGSGKTCLCERYTNDQFVQEYTPSFNPATYSKRTTLTISGNKVSLDIIIKDVVGNLAYGRLLAAVFQGCQGALVVHDPTMARGHDETLFWINALFNAAGDMPLIFAVNKADIARTGPLADREFEVTVRSFRSAQYSTSARTGENVAEAIRHLVTDIVVKRELERFKGAVL